MQENSSLINDSRNNFTITDKIFKVHIMKPRAWPYWIFSISQVFSKIYSVVFFSVSFWGVNIFYRE